MTATLLLADTGPLVALLSRQDQHHSWCVEVLKNSPAPLLTCEPVLTEALFLLSSTHSGTQALWELINRGKLQLAFSLEPESQSIQAFMTTYNNIPMSLADACLVRMSELFPQAHVMTLDSDFQVYRKHRTQIIPCLAPWTEQM